MTDAAWRRGFAELARQGLRFDLQAPWWHLHEAAALAQAALCANIALKISGLGVPGQPWTAAANREIVLTAIELFGADRCMFASNFPVDSLCGTFGQIYEGFAAIVRDFSAAQQRALFHDNAVRIYDIPGLRGAH